MVDDRIPIGFGPGTSLSGVRPDDAVLPRAAPEFGHVPGCACCRPRSRVAAELGRMFLARARGEVPFFRRVVADAADAAAVRAALAGDVLVAARFRLES